MTSDAYQATIEDMEVLVEYLGPFLSVTEALDGVATHVRTTLFIQANGYNRSPAALSHDIIHLDDGYYATVVEVVQNGLIGPVPSDDSDSCPE